jgi:hypothetical protein
MVARLEFLPALADHAAKLELAAAQSVDNIN